MWVLGTRHQRRKGPPGGKLGGLAPAALQLKEQPPYPSRSMDGCSKPLRIIILLQCVLGRRQVYYRV